MQQLIFTIQSDFKTHLSYSAIDLINVSEDVSFPKNELQTSFLMQTPEDLSASQPVTSDLPKSRKTEFINELNNSTTYLASLKNILDTTPDPFKLAEIADLLAKVRINSDLYKHYGSHSMYVSAFKPLISDGSLNRIESEIPPASSTEDQVDEN